MKIKDITELSKLSDYGFYKVVKTIPPEFLETDEKEEEFIENHYVIEGISDPFFYYNNLAYIYPIGHSRRGQFYYILIFNDGEIMLEATKPDGDGGMIDFPDVIIELYKDNLIEL